MVELRPFQRELVDRLADPSLYGRLIGDEMGTGKTYEGLAIEARLRLTGLGRKRRTLIIAPWSVHEMWRRKIIEFMGPLTSIAVIDRKNRNSFIKAVTEGQHDYYICHYEALRLKGMEVLHARNWFHIIADEIHRVKNPKAQQTRAFRRLKTKYKTGMSGSLADDKPTDMWMPLYWVSPGLFPSGGVKNPHKRFIDDWCDTELVDGRLLGFTDDGEEIREHFVQVTGIRKERLEAFHSIIEPFYMRRLKKDVLGDLPDKYSTIINVTLTTKQQRIYDELSRGFRAWIGEHENERLSAPKVIARLVRLQQAALAYLEFYDTGKVDRVTHEPIKKVRLIEPSAKLDQLVDKMKDVTTQVVIFSQSRGMINLTADRLRREGLSVGVYTGMMPDGERQASLDDFQAGKLDVFAGTVKAGGESIDLTVSSTVVFLDRSWSPFRNKQAEDRLHRMGQKNAVEVVDFFARRTVDAKVRNTNIRKWSSLKAMMGDPDD